MTNFEKAIAVCDAALGLPDPDSPQVDTFYATFTPEVVREMLELLHLAYEWGEGFDKMDDYHKLMRKIGGE